MFRTLSREDKFSLGGIAAAVVILAILFFVSPPAFGAVVPAHHTNGDPHDVIPVCDIPICEAAIEACTTAAFEAQVTARACRHTTNVVNDVTCPACPTTIIESVCARWKTRRRGGVTVRKCVRWVIPTLNVGASVTAVEASE